jgi:hypothetical protein
MFQGRCGHLYHFEANFSIMNWLHSLSMRRGKSLCLRSKEIKKSTANKFDQVINDGCWSFSSAKRKLGARTLIHYVVLSISCHCKSLLLAD